VWNAILFGRPVGVFPLLRNQLVTYLLQRLDPGYAAFVDCISIDEFPKWSEWTIEILYKHDIRPSHVWNDEHPFPRLVIPPVEKGDEPPHDLSQAPVSEFFVLE
jgi:hypothetical protein